MAFGEKSGSRFAWDNPGTIYGLFTYFYDKSYDTNKLVSVSYDKEYLETIAKTRNDKMDEYDTCRHFVRDLTEILV